jgi:hypothetical protein
MYRQKLTQCVARPGAEAILNPPEINAMRSTPGTSMIRQSGSKAPAIFLKKRIVQP